MTKMRTVGKDHSLRLFGGWPGSLARGLFLILAAGLLVPSPLLGTRVRPVNLEEMTERADRIFAGRCTDVKTETDPTLGVDVTLATFTVTRAVKGQLGHQVTIMLRGGQDREDGRGTGVPGVPGFRRGEEVILFLYGDSASGFTSPVGMGQGKFVVFKDKQGRKIALNEFGNQALFGGLSQQAEKHLGGEPKKWKGRGGIPPDAILNMVESLK